MRTLSSEKSAPIKIKSALPPPPPKPNHRVLQGAPPRGRQLYFTFPSAPDPLFKALKAPFLTLRVVTPSGAPRQAPPERGILWTQVFLQKERIFPGVHKIGAAISGPLRTRILRTRGRPCRPSTGLPEPLRAENREKSEESRRKKMPSGQKSSCHSKNS